MWGFVRNSCGNVGMMMAAAALPLLLGVGIAIDFGRAHSTRTVLQAAADSAALAGATSGDLSDSQVDALVTDYLVANGANDALSSVSSKRHWINESDSTFNVAIGGKLNSTLMQLAGYGDMDISVTAQVNMGQQALELALVLDNTGSMSGIKIDTLKSSAKELINILEGAKADYSSLKVALVPFSEYVNVGPGAASAPWVTGASAITGWEGCVGSRNSPSDEEQGFSPGNAYPAVQHSTCTMPIQPLTTDLARVRSRIDSMIAQGNTYVPGGLLWGWNVLTPEAPFSEGMSDSMLKQKGGQRVLVLMTDGTNTISPDYPTHNGTNTAKSDTKLRDICRAVNDSGIRVYTVTFMVSDANINALMRNCASAAENAFQADNPTELYAAFKDIGMKLSSVRLTK